MRILWSDLAVDAFREIRSRIFIQFGINAEDDYLAATEKAVNQVTHFPQIGKPEYNLAADGSVRSVIIHKRSKLIYYTDGTTLYIADVWDVRQDPEVLNARFEK